MEEIEERDMRWAVEVLEAARQAGVEREALARIRHLIAIGIGFESNYEAIGQSGHDSDR